MTAYRIEYSIQRAASESDEFEEIGFGSSTSSSTLGGALYAAQSDIQNRQWETTGDMPDPDDLPDEVLR